MKRPRRMATLLCLLMLVYLLIPAATAALPQSEATLYGGMSDLYEKAEETWAYTAMHADEAALAGLTGAGVRIAVIDTGVNADYDFSDGTIADGWNFVTDTDDVSDRIGHGTALCSLIAGLSGNDTGVDGVAPGVTIVPLVFYTLDDDGAVEGGTVELAVDAIYAAVDAFDCDIVSMSWGIAEEGLTDEQYEMLAEACDYAREQGAVLVAAAGNDGTDDHVYPAAFDTVIAVGAVTAGMTAWRGTQTSGDVLICAPGGNVFPGYLTSGVSGTSFATALVSAAAAIALQADPDLTQEDLALLLRMAAVDLGDEGFDDTYGWGFLRVDRLLAVLESELYAVSEEAEGAVTITLWAGSAGTLAVAVYDDGGGLTQLTVTDIQAGACSITVPAGAWLTLYFLGNDGVPLTEPIQMA